MRFFRRRSSPILATLIALAMQAAMLLAHAHTHSHGVAPTGVPGSSKTASIACRALIPPAACKPAIPANHHGERDCPICYSLAAAGVAVVPAAPPAMRAPTLAALTLRPLRAAHLPAGQRTAQFQARAPPAI